MKETIQKVMRYFYMYVILIILHTLLLTTPYANLGNVVNVIGTIYGIIVHGLILLLTCRVIFKEVQHKTVRHALLIAFAFVYVRFFMETISSNIYFIN